MKKNLIDKFLQKNKKFFGELVYILYMTSRNRNHKNKIKYFN